MAGKLDIFPLPAHDAVCDPAGKAQFLRATSCGLNSLALPAEIAQRHSPTAFRVLKRLEGIMISSPILTVELPQLDFDDFFCH